MTSLTPQLELDFTGQASLRPAESATAAPVKFVIRRTSISVRGQAQTQLKINTVTREVFALRRNLLGPSEEILASFRQRKDGRFELMFAKQIGTTLRTILRPEVASLIQRYLGA